MLFPFVRSVPPELYDASKIDGCSVWQRFLHVTLPLISPGIAIVLSLQTISALGTFGLVYGLTGGGPGGATDVLSYFIWENAFLSLDIGYACALTFILAIVSIVITIIYVKYLYRGVEF